MKLEICVKEVNTKTKFSPMVWFTILVLVTVGLALGLPPDSQTQQHLQVSNFAYRIAILLLLIPYGIIWYTAFYAYAKLTEYVHAIKGSNDGRAFRSIMNGIGFLAFGLMVSTIISLIFQFINNHHPGFRGAATIVRHYLSITLLVVSFTLIGNGTRRLTDITRNRPGIVATRLYVLFFLAVSVTFTYLVLKYHHAHPNVYHLNSALLIITFIIPYLFSWFVGLLSAYEFSIYAKRVKGIIYRRALRLLSRGILTTVLGDIIIQFLENTFIAVKANQSISLLVGFEYFLLIIVAVGLTLIALGTNKLKKIEEV